MNIHTRDRLAATNTSMLLILSIIKASVSMKTRPTTISSCDHRVIIASCYRLALYPYHEVIRELKISTFQSLSSNSADL